MDSQVNLTKHLELIPILFKLLKKKKKKRRESFQIHSMSQHYPKTKDTPKKRKLQANIPNEHLCKNPQHNISKPNSTIR